MIKPCVILDGKIINIGVWDDLEGANPMPKGAVIEDRDFEYSSDRGWYEVGTLPEPTAQERLDALEQAMLEMVLGGV